MAFGRRLSFSGLAATMGLPPSVLPSFCAIGFFVLMGTLGHAVLIPATPLLLDAKDNPFVYGLTQSASSGFSLIGSALLGWYSDLRGRRAAVLIFVSLLCVSSCSLLLNIPAVSRVGFALRMSPGVTLGLGATAVTDLLAFDPAARARALSISDAFFAAGFSLGAPVGGRLSRHGVFNNACAAVTIAFSQLLLVILCFPSLAPQAASAAPEASGQSIENGKEESPIRAFRWLVREGGSGVWVLLLSRFFIGFARMLVIATFQLFITTRYDISSEHFGYFLAVVGLSFVLMSALVVPQVLRLGRSQREFFCLGSLVLCVARLGIACAPSLQLVVLADVLVALGSGLVSSAGKAMLVDLVPASKRGLALGAGSSVETAAGVLAPAASGWLYQRAGDFAPSAASAAVCAVAAAVVLCVDAGGGTAGKGKIE